MAWLRVGKRWWEQDGACKGAVREQEQECEMGWARWHEAGEGTHERQHG